jgi:hypothetical protein
MRKRLYISILCCALGLGTCWAQNDASQQPSSDQPQPDTQQQSSGAVPAYGQDNGAAVSNDNPPLSGLDQPSLEPRAPARSFLIPGAHFSQSLDSNIGGGTARVAGITRALGSITLQRLWSRYNAGLDYVGGGAFYPNYSAGATQVHQLDGDQRILWRTGQLAIRDSFSYLPEGMFGFGSFGGAGALSGIGAGFLGGGFGNFFGPGQFASLQQQPRLTNVSIADISQAFSPRSTVTVAGSYGLVHFIDNNFGFINSRQVVAQAAYNYLLSRKDQIGLAYGYQAFRYPSESTTSTFGAIPLPHFNTQLLHLLYGRRISGRMDLVLGGGPQLTELTNPLTGTTRNLSASGRASLRYRLAKSSIGISYYHGNTSGSGFFTGVKSDVGRITYSRPINRLWEMLADVGYTHNTRIFSTGIFLPKGVPPQASGYNYWYAGGSVQRQIGRDFSGFVSYQFNELYFSCGGVVPTGTPIVACGGRSQRHVASVGLDWHPRPIRLD